MSLSCYKPDYIISPVISPGQLRFTYYFNMIIIVLKTYCSIMGEQLYYFRSLTFSGRICGDTAKIKDHQNDRWCRGTFE
jgi:hypothetical protein